MNLASAFSIVAQKNLPKTAVFSGEIEITYQHLEQESAWIAQRLKHAFTVQPGDRMGIWLKNSPQFVSALLGIWKAGAVAVPINNFLKSYEVSYILQDAGIRLLFADSTQAEGLGELRAQNPGTQIFPADSFLKLDTLESAAEISAVRGVSDLAVIIYTSGTTGRPKGAMLSHGNLLHNVESCRQVLQAVSYDRFVLLLPMFHSFMLCVCILLPLLVGGSIVLVKSLHPAKNILQEILHRQATILPAIPQLFRALTSAAIPPNLPLRICISGAAPLPGEILKEFTTKYSVPLIEGYGLSEASPVVSMNPIEGPWKVGSVGKPVPGVEVTLQDDAGGRLGPGEIGELCVRGGNVMLGYWNRPDETAKALKDGWLLTGDIGYFDSDGYFFITDRKKDMLLVNGINVYPREIEEVLYQITGVKEAAVIGVPDPRKGEQPVAFIAPGEGAKLDERAIATFVRGKLADYKVPRRIYFLAALPRNATGKILKTALREMVQSQPDA